MLQYYWNLVTTAFNGAWAIASSIAAGLAIIMGIIEWRIPKWNAPMKQLYWIVPLGIFLILLIIRLIVAPYDIYNKQENIISQLQTAKANPRLEVIGTPIFAVYKYTLKVSNISNEIAENCVASIENVDTVSPRLSPWDNLLANRHLAWEDTNSIQSGESTRLVIALVELNNNNTTIRPAYENADITGMNYMFPNEDVLIIISIRSQDCNPLYSVLHLQKKPNPQDINDINVIASNLIQKPTIDQCRQILNTQDGMVGE